jgi:hypothetical protein
MRHSAPNLVWPEAGESCAVADFDAALHASRTVNALRENYLIEEGDWPCRIPSASAGL